ncbi:MAG: cation-translocating P-type ATPase [Acidimicrobiia bacterium]
MNPTEPPLTERHTGPRWWQLTAHEAAEHLTVDPAHGLLEHEAKSRHAEHGPNELAAAPKRPAWKAFLGQFREFLIVVLLIAAAVSFLVSGELKTPIVIAIVVVVNAVLGFLQEHRAERSLESLRQMLVTRAKVRRDGQLVDIAAADVVPGDVVLVEAGDRVPADGRLLVAANLEIEEAALTGESQPSAKHADVIDHDRPALGDRHNVAFMNTTVTRGRGEILITDTGMRTEMGRIAGLLRETDTTKTPLQHQLDGLGRSLAGLAGVVVLIVFAIGLIRGESFETLFLTAVALAVASVPEGLPAVVAVTLALGAFRMAKRNAIVKKLSAVETLGSTSVICSDKTGTLTLNQMTARALVFQERRHRVTGEGYSTDGEIVDLPSDSPIALDAALLPMALCNEAEVRNGELVGDPTEGALVVLAAKGGVDATSVRAQYPRLAEVPFDSATKFMATFHRMATDDGREVIRLYVKGAPDVVLDRSARAIDTNGFASPIGAHRERLLADNEGLAADGMRVLAVAQRDVDVDDFVDEADPSVFVRDLTFLALAGIVDPARAEAAAAIAECRKAGIKVKMITGDHATTARAIAAELGLEGDAITGADLDTMSDDELSKRVDDIAVFARVAPEHKLRLVKILKAKGNVVAMTGDGVNDAPALKTADMGIAMGITGTEVTKEAATMVLVDDNFSTIVGAVREGRTIYSNIVKFVRFQLSTTIGFAITFLAAAAANIASGKPFTAIQILWVNIIMDGPPAMALGLDPSDDATMSRNPRPLKERILTPTRTAKLVWYGLIMAVGSIAVMQWAPGPTLKAGTPTVSNSMAFATFVLFQVFNLLNSRDETRTIFKRATLTNWRLWVSIVAVVVLQVLVVEWRPAQKLFDTTGLTGEQWLVALGVASSVLVLEELRKLFANIVMKGK